MSLTAGDASAVTASVTSNDHLRARSSGSAPQPRQAGGLADLVVQQAAVGSTLAWQALQTWAFPLLERWARSHPSMRRRRLHLLVDDVHEIVTATLERLHADDFANLHKYLALRATDSHATFEAWLYGAMDFSVREHLRARFGRMRGPALDSDNAAPLAHKRELNTLAPRLAEELLATPREAMTMKLTWSQIMSYVRATFPEREADAVQRYVEQDASYEELADALGLASASEAERMIRKLKERLRTRFRSAP